MDFRSEALGRGGQVIGWDDRAELAKMVIEKLAGKISEGFAHLLEKAIIAGEWADVLGVGWIWVKGSVEALDKARERGDQKSRIGIYAYAWAQTVVEGHHQNTGALGGEAVEAMNLGIRDGLATRDLNPELPAALIAEYGKADNARAALQDAVFGEAGIPVVNHHDVEHDPKAKESAPARAGEAGE